MVLNQQQLNLERDNIVRKRSNKGFRKKAPRVENVMGSFKNYVDRRGWVGGQSNVYEI